MGALGKYKDFTFPKYSRKCCWDHQGTETFGNPNTGKSEGKVNPVTPTCAEYRDSGARSSRPREMRTGEESTAASAGSQRSEDRLPDPMEDAPGDHPRSLISDVSREPEDARMGHGVRPVRRSATTSCSEGRSGGLPRSCAMVSIKRALGQAPTQGRHAARKGGLTSGGITWRVLACR